MSYPAQQDESTAERRNIRRRNQAIAPTPIRRRQSEQVLPEYLPSRPKKLASQLAREADVPSEAQERYPSKPIVPKRKTPAQVAEPSETREYVAEASDAYPSGYDESHLKFEQGVQNNANSYNSDQVLTK